MNTRAKISGGTLAMFLVAGAATAEAQAAAVPKRSPRATPDTVCPIFSERASRCKPAPRLAFDLHVQGTNAREVGIVVEITTSSVGVLAVAMFAATAEDSLLYAVVEVNRTSGGGFEIATRLSGPKAPAGACAGKPAIMDTDQPIIFGALLSQTVERLTRCALAMRVAQH